MATFSALASFIGFMHGDKGATLDNLTAAYTSDFTHFAKANNDERLVAAVQSLAKSPKDKGIAEALTQGRKASGLVVGYIGARTGKFHEQSDEIQATYNNAITLAADAFRASLDSCEAFADKAPKSDADKAKAKDDKAAKFAEANAAIINAEVVAGRLVRAEDVKAMTDFSPLALAEALAGLTITTEALAVLRGIVAKAEGEALAVATAEAKATAEALALAIEAAPVATPAKAKGSKKQPATM